jgi:hypothetical protein
MVDGRVNDEMIEIGDPTEEPTVAEPPPRVVIEYRERGVPWMLIPPLLVLSAVGAVLLYTKLAPHPNSREQASVAKIVESLGPPPAEVPEASVPPVETPIVPVARPELKADEVPPPIAPPSNPVEPVSPFLIPVEPTPEPPKVPEPAPFPRVQGLGFDPKALEADRKAEAPADPALAAVARQDRPDDRDLPREIDPDLLPPDPRQARVRQQQRKLELARKIEDERVRFHAELKVICRKFREKSAPKIFEMSKGFDNKLDPSAKTAAIGLLGKTGKFAGADRRARIEVLRSLGYPEYLILEDLFETYEKQQIGERDGPRDFDEACYFTALFLLRNPPRQMSSSSRPVSAPGNVAGPVR